jgi:hypothetical protein
MDPGFYFVSVGEAMIRPPSFIGRGRRGWTLIRSPKVWTAAMTTGQGGSPPSASNGKPFYPFWIRYSTITTSRQTPSSWACFS